MKCLARAFLVQAAGFSSDDNWLVVVQGDNTIRLWDLARQGWGENEYAVDGVLSSCQMSKTDKPVGIVKTIDRWQLIQKQMEGNP